MHRGEDEPTGRTTPVEPSQTELLAAERRRADSAEQRLRNQTLLFAEAEHKLKTTLAVISGWAATLDESWDKLPDDLRRQGIVAIRRNAEDLAEQAGRLLDDARAEIANLDLDPVRLELNEVLGVTTGLFGGVSRAHRVLFDAEPGEVWAWVDPAALQQVLGHLIENAVKYSPEGGDITMRTFVDGAEAHLEVRDQGVGVPEDVNLFAAFQRGDEETHGAGLGLYIVRNLVEGMGGRISAKRNDDRPGSTFTVVLPAD
ncbi:MAG TPA: ATP-binding protein [Acidimicrobiales bacterium]|jgi:signal transduction histidine kinase|nr:ATP-binding protein [Acidimicrobiales bacterium]